eukprot:Skav226829  [mRNA]  locus=scaffold606:294151:304584:+ [translate_table: standard]
MLAQLPIPWDLWEGLALSSESEARHPRSHAQGGCGSGRRWGSLRDHRSCVGKHPNTMTYASALEDARGELIDRCGCGLEGDFLNQVMELDSGTFSQLMQSVEEGGTAGIGGKSPGVHGVPVVVFVVRYVVLFLKDVVSAQTFSHVRLGVVTENFPLCIIGLLSFETGVQMQSCAVVDISLSSPTSAINKSP